MYDARKRSNACRMPGMSSKALSFVYGPSIAWGGLNRSGLASTSAAELLFKEGDTVAIEKNDN